MSFYEKIDPILGKWGSDNNISWFNRYQDKEVRTFFLSSTDTKKNIQVWINEPINIDFDIHTSDNNKIYRKMNKFKINTRIDTLYNDLSKMLSIAKTFI